MIKHFLLEISQFKRNLRILHFRISRKRTTLVGSKIKDISLLFEYISWCYDIILFGITNRETRHQFYM